MLIDAHAHLGLCDPDCLNALPGLTIDCATDLDSARACVERAESRPGVYCAVGVHPESAGTLDADATDALARLFSNPKTIAIGEIGLDYHYPSGPDEATQIRALVSQLRLAHSLRAPIVLHVRDAHADMLRILRENRDLLGGGFAVHCFSGAASLVPEYLELGGYLSYGGALTFGNAASTVAAFRATPLDRVLAETDSPYLSPAPFRGRPNSPARVRAVYERMSELAGVEPPALEKAISENAFRLFGKLDPGAFRAGIGDVARSSMC